MSGSPSVNGALVGINKDTRKTALVTVEEYEKFASLYTVPGHHRNSTVHLDAQAVEADTGFMLVDVSNTSAWKHEGTDHIDLEYVHINIDPDTNYRGDIYLGFLSNVDADNGDLNIIRTWHFGQGSDKIVDDMVWGQGGHFECTLINHFGPIQANSALWQTDVNLVGPPGGAAAYPSGNGDLVLRIARTAGKVDLAITLGYLGEDL